MGIPVYFKTLVSEYSDTILHKDKYNDINSLFFDLNCLIHPSVRGLTDEDEMITKILSDITKLIEYTGVKKLVYIAIDGIAPKGKMKQQRQRRFKSALERKYSSDNSWNTNAISPGTYFMSKLNEALNAFIKTLKIKTILSDSDERGEGEHKILHYIKTNDLNNKICIYGLDADLIMLSLVSGKEDIVLLRERTEYNIEKTENDYIYLKIDPLKDHIIQSLDIQGSNKEQIINDYIFICFLLGNDFMNHVPSLNLRYGGHDLLLRIYSELQKRYQGYFQLIDHKQPDLLHMTFFKEFIQEISLKEKETMRKIFLIRDRQSKKIHNEYHNDFQIFKNQVKDNLSLEDIYKFQRDSLSDKDHPGNGKKMIENLPILYSFGERKEYNEMKYSDKLCKDYMKSLLWTTHYYFDKCCDWRFSTEYNEAPLTEHLFRYITDHKVDLDHNDNEFSNYEQLSYIFPQDSHHLHKHDIISKDYQMIINLSFHRYLWECEIDFI